MADVNKIVRAFVRVRDARRAATSAYKRSDAEFKTNLGTLNAALLAELNAAKVKGMKADDGTFYKKIKITASIDKEKEQELFDWIMEDAGRLDAFQRRLKMSFFADYMNKHKDVEGNAIVPPGAKVYREWVIQVVKAGEAIPDEEYVVEPSQYETEEDEGD
jgi:hypothetical protein